MCETDRFFCCQSAQIQSSEPNKTHTRSTKLHYMYQPTFAHDKSFFRLAFNSAVVFVDEKIKLELFVFATYIYELLFWLALYMSAVNACLNQQQAPRKENANKLFAVATRKICINRRSEGIWRFRTKLEFVSVSSMIFQIFFFTLHFGSKKIWNRRFSNFH